MFKRQISCLLALVMILQIVMPFNAFARENKPSHTNFAKVGEVSTKDYPKIDTKLILQRNKEVARSRKHAPAQRGVALKKSDYVDGSDPSDSNKPKYFGRVSAELITKGLDNGPFQWGEIFGKDGAGNNNPIRIEFHQLLDDSPTGIQFSLEVDKNGTYKWQDGNGNPTLLPLYSVDFKPFKYSVFIDKGIAEKVKLITSLSAPTPSTTFKKENGKFVADIKFKIDLQQVAATNFTSVWKTEVEESGRPQIQGNYVITEDGDEITTPFNFPKNDTDRTVIRDGFVENFVEDEANEIYALIVDELVNTPKSVEVKTDTSDLTFDTTHKTVTSGDHKYKYDFKYDVITGGKLTMTEVIPVTFDANGGKFDSVTDPAAEQKIVKEVEYDGTLTEKAEEPTKDRETFKGWSTTEDGKNPVTDQDFKNITKAKTLYAIWDNNDIEAKELEVKESFKDGETWVNNFIPTLAQLKEQVKIKDAKGVLQALADTDTFAIVDGANEYTTDAEAKDYLYNLLKEDDGTEVSRKVTLKARVTHKNKTTQDVDIPIKVLKNIYEAKTEEGKPNYVPADYVKVTVDPTTKAKDPQKYFYYVNPDAKVVIPGKDPVGEGENQFTKWLIDGTTEEYKLADKPRYQFKNEATIKAQYVSNVIPANDDGSKPDNVPSTFVLVEFKDGGKGTLAGTTKYWVNPTAGKKLSDITHPTVTADDGWKQNGWDKADSTEIKGKTEVTAQYLEKVLTKEPTENADKYVKVEFTPGNHGTIESTETSAYWVLKDEAVTLTPPTVTPKEGYIQKTGDDAWSPKVAKSYSEDVTHVAQYNYTGSNVIPQDGDDKPEIVPDNFVQVIVDKTNKAKLDEGEKKTQVFWVKPATKVRINVKDPVAKDSGEAFAGWKDKSTDETVNLDKENIFTEKVTEIEASYGDLAIPQRGKDKPGNVPKNFIRVFFDTTDKAKVEKRYTWWVAPKNQYVPLVLDSPVGKEVKDGDDVFLYKWKFSGWENKERGLTCNDVKKRAYYLDTTKIKDGDVFKAKYELDFVIPYDPAAPFARPEGYARVTFEAENGLKLEKPKAYYVKKNAGIQLKDKDIVKPDVTAETGYKFEKWNKEDSLVIREDVVVKAKATKLNNVIPEKDDKGNKNDKPEGYKEVNFVIKTEDKDKGSITGVAKFYVNPTEYVTINPPSTKAETGFEFGTWDKDTTIPTVYENDTTVTGSFNDLEAVIPKTNPDGAENKQPAGYKTVTFVIDPATGGKIADGEVRVYYVNPAKEVTVPQPKTNADTGYEFDKWDQDTATAKKYTDNATVKGNFKKLEDIIPSKKDDGTPNAKPDGYITVTFEKGEHGKEITGQTTYYVNPTADPAKTIGEIKKPTVKAETGWKTNGWDKADTDKITGTQDITVTAKYDSIDDVVDGSKPKPEGYITVTFKSTDKGSIGSTVDASKVVYVNPNKAVALEDKAPKVTPNTGYDFAGWDTQLEKKIQYSDGDIIKALYNEKGDVIPQEKTDGSDRPAGYLTVTFVKGDHGELSGKTVYYVKPNKEVTVPAPTVKANVGYAFSKWDKELTQTFTADNTTITAQYDSIDNIVPGDKSKPDGYVTVTFKAVNGSLTGTTTYYVNPKVSVDLTKAENGLSKTPNVGYKGTGSWNPVNLSGTFTADTTFTFTFDKLDDVIPATEGQTRPDGYVMVQFIAGLNGSLDGGNKTYYVNPNKGVKIGDTASDKVIATPTPKAETDYAFEKWAPEIDKTKSITHDQNYVAQFVNKPATVTLTYEAKDATSGEVPDPQIVKKGDKAILADAKTLTKENATFKGWKIDGTVYSPGSSVTLNENTKATAVWTTNSYTVEFNTDGGRYIPSQKVAYGSKIKPVTPPTKAGHTFTGWTLNKKSFDPTKDTITGDSTLEANYVPNVIPETGNGKPDNVPKNFVPVTVDPTNKATDSKKQVFWVKRDETVQIPAKHPTGKQVGETTYVFDSWNPSLIGKFSEPTTITAKYKEQTPLTPIFDPRITTRVVATDLNKQPPLEAYKDQIISESHKEFDLVQIVEQPKVNKSGFTSAKIEIRFTENDMTQVVDVLVYVKPAPVIIEKPYPVPGDCNNSCDQPNQPNKPGESNKPNQPNQPNIGMDALNTTDHYQYLIGYPDGNFAPNRGMTRAEVATMFTRLLRERPVKGQRYYTGFSDIQAGDWYANTVGYAVQVGIVSGYPDGSFKPNKPITRAEFAAIASRFDALAQGNNIAFNDLAPSHWGYNAIRSAASKGWISGYPDNTFRPEKAISRAEVTSITNRMLNRYADLYWIDAHRAEVIRFGDVKRSDWYFEPIMEATMGHDFIRDRDGKTEHWTGVNGKSFI